MPELVPIPGSERAELAGAAPASQPLDDSQVITVTALLRRRAEVPRALVAGPETVSPAELADAYGADRQDAQLVTEVLREYGLTVTEAKLSSRRLKVTGTIADMSRAFGVELSAVRSPHPDGSGHVQHRYRTGPVSVPAQLSGIITALLGLDDRPQARPHFRYGPEYTPQPVVAPEAMAAAMAEAKAGPLTAPQVASFYQFPAGTDGSGQTIGVIELGGGYTADDLNTYFSGLGLAVPSVTSVGVDGGSNSPGKDSDADGEVLLDIQVAGAVAPGASQVVYFAPNTDMGFVDAISDAVHATPTPAVVSISWGGPEDSWSAQSHTAMDAVLQDAAALGVTVCVAAGDHGSSDDPNGGAGVHCDFPASSPHALACGGTKLVGSTATYTISSEVVWNDADGWAGGGGVSDVFPVPSWQANAGVQVSAAGGGSGRGVPDVAGNADPVTGYLVVVHGRRQAIGGTSAVAPLWAGLIARLAQSSGKRFGLMQPLLYAGVTPGVTAAGFNDIVDGDNGAYKAGPGWDACTGLGSPNGTALLSRLS